MLRSTHQGSPKLADRLLGSCRRLNATYTHIIPPRGLEARISLCVWIGPSRTRKRLKEHGGVMLRYAAFGIVPVRARS